MLGASARKAYVLMGVEPEWDANAPAAAVEALSAADCVVMLGSYASAAARDYADVLLPIAPFSETSGTYVNAEGRWQSTHGAVPPLGEARPGWKVLRVLGNLLDLRGFDQTSSETVREELKACFPADLSFDNRVSLADAEFAAAQAAPLERAGSVAIYRLDPVVRRAASLQATGDGSDVALRLHPDEAEALGLREATQVTVEQDGHRATLPLILDERIARGCAWLPAGTDAVTGLGAAVGPMTLEGS
jgi:NADH-quinone oxidoreductase subunit G